MMGKLENKFHIKNLNTLLLDLSFDIMKTGKNSLNKADCFFLSIINRAISLNDAFVLLVENENSFSAISIVRLQLDNIIRLHALDVSENPIELLQHFYDGKAISFYKEKRAGKFIKFSDKFLVSELDKELSGVLQLNNFLCDFIHLSDAHFKATHVESNNPKALFSIEIGNSNILNENEKNLYYDQMIKISSRIIQRGYILISSY